MSDTGKGWQVGVPVLLGLLILGFLAMPFFRPRSTNGHSSCPNNLHQLGLAIGSYTNEHQDRYPDPDKWPHQLLQYVKTWGVFICPVRTSRGLPTYPTKHGERLMTTYSMNERLRGLSVQDLKKPEETVLLFESNGERLYGGPELLPKETRHEETRYLVIHDPYVHVLFADLHVNKVLLDEVPKLKWDPK